MSYRTTLKFFYLQKFVAFHSKMLSLKYLLDAVAGFKWKNVSIT